MSRLVLQPIISSSRWGVGVNVAVVVTVLVILNAAVVITVAVALNVAVAVDVRVDCDSVTVIIEGRKVIVRVTDRMNGGVGVRITGKDDGVVTGVEITKGILVPEHATMEKRIRKARIVLSMSASDKNIVSENQENRH
jgi:hypothetical protein